MIPIKRDPHVLSAIDLKMRLRRTAIERVVWRMTFPEQRQGCTSLYTHVADAELLLPPLRPLGFFQSGEDDDSESDDEVEAMLDMNSPTITESEDLRKRLFPIDAVAQEFLARLSSASPYEDGAQSFDWPVFNPEPINDFDDFEARLRALDDVDTGLPDEISDEETIQEYLARAKKLGLRASAHEEGKAGRGKYVPWGPTQQQRVENYVDSLVYPTYKNNRWDQVIKILEATICFYTQWKTLKNRFQLQLAVQQYLRVVTNKSLSGLIGKLCDWVVNKVADLVAFCEGYFQSGDEDETIFALIRHWLEKSSANMTHPIVLKLRMIFQYVVAHAMLERFGISFKGLFFDKAMEEANGQITGTNFIWTVTETVLYVVERLYTVMQTGSWSAILHSGKSYHEWAAEAYKLKEDAMKLHNPGANGIDYFSFLGRLEKAIEKGESICKHAAISKPEKTAFQTLCRDLRLIQATEFTKTAAKKMRPAPFSFLFYGGSALGKSTLLEVVFDYLSKVLKLPNEDEYRYTRTFSDEYWSGFSSSCWFLVLDDIAARNPSLADDTSMDEIIQIVNNVPFVPPQADVADKGKTPLRPAVVVGTTNVKGLNAPTYYCNELAVLRRFPFVITTFVKAEYCIRDINGAVPDPEERMLDKSRCVNIEGQYPDFWDFKIEKIVANTVQNHQYAKHEMVHGQEYVDINFVLRFLAREALDHRDGQVRMNETKENLKSCRICDVCFAQVHLCECAPPHVGEEQSKESAVAGLAAIGALSTLLWNRKKIYQSMKGGASDAAAGVARDTIDAAIDHITQPSVQSRIGAAARGVVNRTVTDGVKNTYAAVHGAVNSFIPDGVKNTARAVEGATRSLTGNYLLDIRLQVARNALTVSEKMQLEKEMFCEFARNVGDRIRTFGWKSKWMLGLIAALPMIYKMYEMYTRVEESFEQSSADDGTAFKVKDEKQNPWVRDEYEPMEFELGALTKSWKLFPFNQVVDTIGRNVVYCTARFRNDAGEARRIDCRLLGLGSNLYVTTRHSIPDRDCTLSLVASPHQDGINSSFDFFLGKFDRYNIPEADLIFFRIGCMPPKKNLLDLIPAESFRCTARGVVVGRNDVGKVHSNVIEAVHRDDRVSLERGCTFKSWHGKVAADTVKGDCGSALVLQTATGPMIAGLHQFGGMGQKAWSVQLTREYVQQAIDFFQLQMVQSGSPDLRDASGQEITLLPVHGHSTFRFIQEGVGHMYGSLPGFRAKHKSKVCDTYITDAMVARGYEVKVGRPVMSGWEPWRHAAVDIVHQPFKVRQNLLDACVEHFAHDILQELDTSTLASELIILNNDITLNGQPGVQFIDKMNRKSSGGFPWHKSKSKGLLTTPIEYEEWPSFVEFTPDVMERVENIIEKYKSGERHMPIYTAHLKDEALKLSKVQEKKTRVFSGAPCDWVFVVRKYLLSFVRLVQKNKFTFESGPGTQCHSVEWDQFYHYLTAFGGDRIIAGDYSKFDKRMSAQWILGAFKVIDFILQAAGWSDQNRRIVQCIAFDTAFPLTDFNGDLFEFWGSNPSGHPLTVIVNGLVNSLLLRYAWALAGNDLADFKKSVHLMTYGDDNIMGVSPSAKNFDHTVIQEKLASIGVVYTMADKEAESVPFVSISDVSFLKRKWVFEPELGSHVAQIEHDSIVKSLVQGIPSKVMIPQAKAVVLMVAALREYAYFGRSMFEAKRQMFLEIIAEKELEAYYEKECPDGFLTWEQYITDYLKESEWMYAGGVCPVCTA